MRPLAIVPCSILLVFFVCLGVIRATGQSNEAIIPLDDADYIWVRGQDGSSLAWVNGAPEFVNRRFIEHYILHEAAAPPAATPTPSPTPDQRTLRFPSSNGYWVTVVLEQQGGVWRGVSASPSFGEDDLERSLNLGCGGAWECYIADPDPVLEPSEFVLEWSGTGDTSQPIPFEVPQGTWLKCTAEWDHPTYDWDTVRLSARIYASGEWYGQPFPAYPNFTTGVLRRLESRWEGPANLVAFSGFRPRAGSPITVTTTHANFFGRGSYGESNLPPYALTVNVTEHRDSERVSWTVRCEDTGTP